MKDKIKLCLIGCGRAAGSHFSAISQLGDYIDLAAVVSRDEGKAKTAKEQSGAKRYYLSIDEALDDDEVEAVDICLPHYMHASVSIESAKHGKHILVEKPMALTTSEANEMIQSAEENNVVLMVGQSRRFFNAVLESKKRISAGEIGNLIHVSAMLFAFLPQPATDWWTSKEKSGGLIIPLWGSHIVDYILWIFDKKPARVYAELSSNNPLWEGEDEASILMGFDNGAMATIQMSYNVRSFPPDVEGMTDKRIWLTQDSRYERYIIGSKGTMHLNDEKELTLNGEKVAVSEDIPANFVMELREFATSILEGRQPLASGREVKKVVEVTEAIFQSASSKKVIFL